MNLGAVATFRVLRPIITETEHALSRAGREGFEMFVLWSGVIDDQVFEIRNAHVPKQHSYKTEDGLFVRVGGEALHELNTWLYEHGEILGVQIHAHPTEAFHSDTDDTYPIVATLGALSIVVPDFACQGLLTEDTAAFRLTMAGWEEVQLSSTLEVTE